MKILAMEAYYGGSHQAFLDGWRQHSRHDFTLLTLPPYKWKWRMRHAAITFADEARRLHDSGVSFDILWCSDMLNLASFLGLAPAAWRPLPSVCYFHENQLTYPVRHKDDRDYHFAFTNITSALAATEIWFNSAFHRGEFQEALAVFCGKMPDHAPTEAGGTIEARSRILPPGIQPPDHIHQYQPGAPLHLLWAARWEYDKAPEQFFAAIDRLAESGCDFRLSVLGESFKNRPEIFDKARVRHRERIVNWGYQETSEGYARALAAADVAISTARHEFFGIGLVEAMAAGLYPLAPRRLAYPEVLDADRHPEFLYDGDVDSLVHALQLLIERHATGDLWQGDAARGRRQAEHYWWSALAPAMDDRVEQLADGAL